MGEGAPRQEDFKELLYAYGVFRRDYERFQSTGELPGGYENVADLQNRLKETDALLVQKGLREDRDRIQDEIIRDWKSKHPKTE